MTSMFGHSAARFGSCILIFSTTLAHSATENLVTPKTDSVYKLANLSVSVPIMVHTVIQNFIKGNSVNVGKTRVPNFSSLRRVLLYGPFGVGKTEIAKKIAEVTNSELIELSGSGVINSFQGSGAATIKNTFAIIAQKLKKRDARIVLFIDEVDGITSNNIPDNYKDMKNAQLELWQALEKFRLERRLLIIFATNNLSNIPGGTLSRMHTKIEVLAATVEQRAELLQAEFSRCNRPHLAEYMLATVIEELATINPALIKIVESSGVQLGQSLVALVGALESYDVVRKNHEQLQSIELLIARAVENSTIFFGQVKKECPHSGNTEVAEKSQALVQEYFNGVMQYLTDVKDYLATQQPSFTPDQLALLAKSTEGMSHRLLVGLVENIAEKYYNNNKVLTDDIIAKALEQAKKNLNLELKDVQRTQEAEIDKEETRKDRKLEREHRIQVRADYAQERKSKRRDELLKEKAAIEESIKILENILVIKGIIQPGSPGYELWAEASAGKNEFWKNAKKKLKKIDEEIIGLVLDAKVITTDKK